MMTSLLFHNLEVRKRQLLIEVTVWMFLVFHMVVLQF